MHRRAHTQHRRRRTSEESFRNESRVSGEMFIERQQVSVMSSIETRCAASRLDRRGERKSGSFYKYFALTALTILLLWASPIFSGVAQGQHQTSQSTPSSIPSPR